MSFVENRRNFYYANLRLKIYHKTKTDGYVMFSVHSVGPKRSPFSRLFLIIFTIVL